jgi:hypothetical protein
MMSSPPIMTHESVVPEPALTWPAHFHGEDHLEGNA